LTDKVRFELTSQDLKSSYPAIGRFVFEPISVVFLRINILR
jgi:hypothetical protein